MFVDDLFDKKSLTEAQGGGSPWHSEPEQQQMDANRRGRLGRERNAGLDEPDDAVSGSVQTGNGVYEYTVPAGQEGLAQELGLQQHRGHWVSRVPIQRANFQFGQPQFHEIPSPGVAEGSTFPGPLSDREWSKVGRQIKSSQGRDGSVTSPHQRKDWYNPKDPRSSKQQKLDYLKSMKAKQGVAEGSQPNDIAVYHHTGPNADKKAQAHAIKLGSDYGHFRHDRADKNDNLHIVTQKRYFPAYAKQQGVAEGSNDTIFPNAEVIKSRNGRPVGEIYQDENGWGFFHYRMDSGNDFIDSREDAIEGLRDLHQETVRSRPDYTIKGVAEAATPASVSKVLRLAQRHKPEWFDNYGMGEVEDTVVDMAEMGQFHGMSAEDALALVGQELESLYGQQGVAEGSSTNAEVTKRAKAAAQKAGKTFDTDVEYRLWYAITTQANAATRKADKKQGVAEGLEDKVVFQGHTIGHIETDSDGDPVGIVYSNNPQSKRPFEIYGYEDVNHLKQEMISQWNKRVPKGVAEGDDIGYHQTSGTKAGHTISSRKLSNKPQASKSDVTLQSGSMHHSGKSYDFPKGTLFTQLPGGIFAKHPSVPETHPGYGHLIRRSEDNIHAIHNALNGQQGVGEGMMDNPGEQDSPVAQAIIRRILLQRTDLLAKHGPEKVGQAVDEVADFVGDVDEIGSSDVSGWVRHVEQMLGNMEQDVAEGNMISKIKAPSSPALAIPKAPAVAETIARVERMLESVTSKKSAEMIKAYVDQKFTELGLRNTTECQNLMAHVVHESAVRRRAYAQRMAK
jgi:hypothetical protein